MSLSARENAEAEDAKRAEEHKPRPLNPPFPYAPIGFPFEELEVADDPHVDKTPEA